MDLKEIKFYLKFHKEFRKNYTLNSALKSNLLQWNEFDGCSFSETTPVLRPGKF